MQVYTVLVKDCLGQRVVGVYESIDGAAAACTIHSCPHDDSGDEWVIELHSVEETEDTLSRAERIKESRRKYTEEKLNDSLNAD